ncbi:TonB-dependent receptor domain-containing protein [Algoriphagus terrigena]|uniref:TonB-dependent receptor domain-containing protein n=1 Tax=Algoriphagus terrigena TaxID=344884 RepID=UPI000415EBF7|nr:TonB-dependent receptor [Algoriphagus terrigena]
MKKLLNLILALTFFGAQATFAQQAGESKAPARIIGVAKDLKTGEPVGYATAALYKTGTEVSTSGAVADGDGMFFITGFDTGVYELHITFLGYETVKRTVNINSTQDDINLGEIGMTDEGVALEEVTVQGQRELIEERVDRTIYKAENDKTTAGGDGTDVLRRVPMLSVDLDGNVSMRGSSNILVLINNRPSAIAASSIADALKQIPADEIKAVEVITSPSAKYDAEGTSGVINIITKKNNLQGATLNVNTGFGLRGSNLGLQGSARKGKFGFTLGGFGRAGYNVLGSFENKQVTNSADTLFTTIQSADTERRDIFGRYNFGVDYDINEYNFLTAAVNFGVRNSKNWQTDYLTEKFRDGLLYGSENREVYTLDNSNSVDVSLNYTRTFEKKGRELSFLTLYSTNTRENDKTNTLFEEDSEVIASSLKNINPSKNEEFTVQLDYVTPLDEKGNKILEYGAKNILRKAYSDYSNYLSEGPDGEFIELEDARASNDFIYDQNVTAGYVSYTTPFLKNYTLKAGVRYEYTNINADFKTEFEVDIPSYGTFVPSLNASRKLANGNLIKAAYNRRIQRPSLMFLNPNIDAVGNQEQITQGNPELDPEMTDNYELGYSTFIKSTTLNFTGFYRNTTGSIQPIRTVQADNRIFTTYENIGQEQAVGTNIFFNINISNKLSLSGGGDLYYAMLDNGLSDPQYAAKNDGFVVSGRLFGNYTLPKDWQVQVFSFARGRQVQLQGSSGGFAMYGLNFNKQFDEKRGSIGFGAENFLMKEFTVKNEIITPTIMQNSTNTMRNMNFKVNFSYRIGKMSMDQRPKRRKSINNDDMKEGGDGGQMENQNAGGGAAPARNK